MPGLLLLVARDLLLFDPPRVLAWRLLHDPRLARLPAWLSVLLPRPGEALDRDPVALLLGAIAAACAALYLVAAWRGAAPRIRAAIVGVAALALVAAPSLALIGIGLATGRPYGQDGGVVQLPLAIDKLLAGESPYGADYSDSILGKEARVSDFWAAWGGNPILHHHAYLPGTHLVMLPFHLASRALLGAFDPRCVTLVALTIAALLAARLAVGPERRLAAAALMALNPLVYWHQVFGANDVIVVALLLAALLLAQRQRPLSSAAVLGLACASKQLAWPFAPFLLVQLSGARSYRELLGPVPLRRLARAAAAAGAVFAAVVLPVAALDFGRFWGDIVVYNVGLPGADNYPLGGTPGFGFANFLIYFGRVASLKDYVPFGAFYVLLIPIGLLLLRHQLREGRAATCLVTGSAALCASLYLSRVVHPNYLVIPAILLPLGLLLGEQLSVDVAVVPLLLFSTAVELADHELLRALWEDGVAVRLPQHLSGIAAALAPRAGPGLTLDPLGLALSGLAAGLAVLYLIAGVLGASARVRLALVALAVVLLVVMPTAAVLRIESATGVVRGQDPWLASVVTAARPADASSTAAAAREAWSSSFRRDPPGALDADGTPGPRLLGWLLGRLGGSDPRPLSLLALALCAALILRFVGASQRPLALGATLLSPLSIVGVVFGSGAMLGLAGVLGALWLARIGRGIAAAALAVAALALGPQLLSPTPPRVEPGLGLANLLLYRDAGQSPAATLVWLLPWAVILAGALAWWKWRPAGASALVAAGALLLVALLAASGGSPHALLAPFALLVLAALAPGPGAPDVSGDSPGS